MVCLFQERWQLGVQLPPSRFPSPRQGDKRSKFMCYYYCCLELGYGCWWCGCCVALVAAVAFQLLSFLLLLLLTHKHLDWFQAKKKNRATAVLVRWTYQATLRAVFWEHTIMFYAEYYREWRLVTTAFSSLLLSQSERAMWIINAICFCWQT